jgi:hypothetical protein
MKSTNRYACTGKVVPLPFYNTDGFRQATCLSCMAQAIGNLQNAVYQHRPSNRTMLLTIEDAIRPLTARITALEAEVSALRNIISGCTQVGVLPYTKNKTAAARELFQQGRPTNKWPQPSA